MCFFKKKTKKSDNMQENIIKNFEKIPKQEVFYSLDYILQFFNSESETEFSLYYSNTQQKWISEGKNIPEPNGKICVYHDISLKKYRLTVQLEPDRWWFLSVFFHESGEFDMFSFDFEAADDSHYEFVDEEKVRRRIYKPGDEKLYLHEVFIRFIKEKGNGNGQHGGFDLLHYIPVTQAFHYY